MDVVHVYLGFFFFFLEYSLQSAAEKKFVLIIILDVDLSHGKLMNNSAASGRKKTAFDGHTRVRAHTQLCPKSNLPTQTCRTEERVQFKEEMNK